MPKFYCDKLAQRQTSSRMSRLNHDNDFYDLLFL